MTSGWRRPLRLLAPILVVFAVAAAVSVPHWSRPVPWTDPDAIWYQARVEAIQGHDQDAAVRRLFASPIAAELHGWEAHKPVSERQWTHPWLGARRFFDRRWLVPAMAAAIDPLFGLRSLFTVSMVAYLLLGPALYLLLRRRFSPGVSVVVASICVLAPPVRDESFIPMTDSWGLLLETLALLAASLALDRDNRWLLAWVAAIAALSLTRDNHIVALVAAICIALHQRERRSAWLAVTGVAAAIPAPLILGAASIRENLAYVLSGFDPDAVDDASWGFILREYWPHLKDMLHSDLTYGLDLGWETFPWYAGLALAAIGLFLLVKRTPAADPFFRLQRYSILGAIAVLAVAGPQDSAFRLELVFLPPIAVALALVGERVAEHLKAARWLPKPRQERFEYANVPTTRVG
jgi:hypothetical protein